MTGKPMRRQASTASSAPDRFSCVPGTTGTPASIIFLRAEILSPIASIVSGRGPMNTSPASAHRRAKSAFSDRNP